MANQIDRSSLPAGDSTTGPYLEKWLKYYNDLLADMDTWELDRLQEWWLDQVGEEYDKDAIPGWNDNVGYVGLGKLPGYSDDEGTASWGESMIKNQVYWEYLKTLRTMYESKSTGVGSDSPSTGNGEISETPASSYDPNASEALADAQKAIQTGLQQQQTQAQDTAKNAAAAGVSKSQAGTLSDQATQQQQTQNVGAMYAANNSQRSSTQADYLEKMQNVANLEQQAKWAKEAESSSILSGLLQGGATGLGLGATIFGAVGAASGGGGAGAGAAATAATGTSDERMKKAPRACNRKKETSRGMLNDSIDEKEMRKMIKQFKDLYTRVKKLKAEKEAK